jgi:AcrR family transcriptional regulator
VPDQTSLDPRVRRTRRALEEAVLALAEERDFYSITIRDITARAEINRATFYLHYRDKEDVIARALDTLFEELVAEDRALAEADLKLAPESVPLGIVAQFRHVAERPELFRRLLAETGSMGFAARLRAYYERNFMLVWHNMGLAVTPGTPPAELRAKYASAASLAVFLWWLDHGRAESVEAIAAWCWTLSSSLFFENVAVGGITSLTGH